MRAALVRTATSVAVVISASCVSAAVAFAEEGEASARVLLFSGFDLWRSGAFAYDGVYWAPGGLDRDGFMLKALLGSGVYVYTSGALGNRRVSGRALGAQILPGWRFSEGTVELKVFAGLDVGDYRLSPDDPSAGLRGRHTGAQFVIEAWQQPTETTMVAGHAAVSTIGGLYHARIAYGWRLFDLFYAGPELSGFSTIGCRQARVGLHVTGLRTGAWEWSAALGFAHDSDGFYGLYGRFGVLVRR